MNTTPAKDTLEFLPAILEIQESPPLPASRCILWTIMLFFTAAVGWSCLGEVDVVGIAHGKIIPGSRIKIIQPLEPGMVSHIHVREGDQVVAGMPLVDLDSTVAGADRAQVNEQHLMLKLVQARLLAVLDALEVRKSPLNPFSGLGDAEASRVNLQREWVKKQLEEYHAHAGALGEEIRQRQAERRAVVQRIQQLDATIPLITERARSLEDLAATGMMPRHRWLELEQERIGQVKERDVQESNLAMLDAAIANITQRLTARKADYATTLLAELADTEARLAAFEQERLKAEKRVTWQRLVAPVNGTVHQLAVHTIGGVVTPAQDLMHIVPDEDGMEVEAWLPNKDVGFVHEGQAAEIKVETFPFTQYGTVRAEVLDVSSDATPDERLGLVYAMRVKMLKTSMQVRDRIVKLAPGMAVTVEVNMGRRRLIEFILSPLLRYKNESARER